MKRMEWQTMVRTIEPPPKEETIAGQMKMADQTPKEAIAHLRYDEFWRNDTYGAGVRRFKTLSPFMPSTHVSISRWDEGIVREWWDLQRIKNDVLGLNVEAFEIYPADTRVVDIANAYHLWAFPAGFRIPLPMAIGKGRMVTTS
jgi:hypothetical protein